MKLEYWLTDEARKRIFIETGVDPKREQALEADPAQLRVEHRRLLAEVNPSLGGAVTLKASYWDHTPRSATLELNAVATDPAELLAVYADARAAGQAAVLAGLNASLDRKLAELRDWSSDADPAWPNESFYAETGRVAELREAYQLAKARARERADRYAREREAEAQRKAAEREAKEAEKRAWIEVHGSAFLKKACLVGGYDCQRRYVAERAAVEFPGYTVDFHDKAGWKSRSCPSERALDEALRVGGEVVWLTAYPVDDGSPEEYQEAWEQETEAVVVRGFLGKYDLIKAL